MLAQRSQSVSRSLILCASMVASVSLAAIAGCGGGEPLPPTPRAQIEVERPTGCRGTSLSSEQLDLNVRTAHLRGNLLLNGQPLAPSNLPRGSIVLFDTRSGSVQFVAVGSNNTGAFDVQIPLGTYEVRFAPAECSATNLLPCTPVVLERSLALQSDTTRNFNVTTATVTLSVTLDGQAPSSLDGMVVFENAAGGSSFIRLSETRSFAVAPDTYRVRYLSASGSCAGPIGPWPCGHGVITRDLRIERSQAVALDVRTTLLNTSITANGAAGDVRDSRFNIELQDSSGELHSIGYTELANGALPPMRVVRDRYRLYWAPAADTSCSLSSNMPCNRGFLAEFDADAPTRAVTAAVQSVTVRGSVQFDGAPAHTQLPSAGHGVVFMLGDDKSRGSVAVGVDSSYVLRMFKGSRAALGFSTQSNGCAAIGLGGTSRPCGEAIFAPSAAWDADRTLDAALRTHAVRFAVRIDDNLVSAGGVGALAGLWLRANLPGAGQNRTTALDSEQYRVIEGTYQIGTRNGELALGCDVMSSVPCGEHVIARERAITSDGVVTIEARTRRLSGAVRIGGAQPTFAAQPPPGHVGLFSTNSQAIMMQLTTGGPAMYSARVIDAPVVAFVNSSVGCSMDEPSASTGAPALCGLSFVTGCE
ncbi:MAG: hypothetical protein U0269_36025 [Polyangiales bacterium]